MSIIQSGVRLKAERVSVRERLRLGLGWQFRQPKGLPGAALGRAMTVLNSRPNRLAIETLSPRPDETLLELGFGPGAALARLLALNGNGVVAGIDHSDAMFSQAQRRNAAAHSAGRLDLRHGSFTHLPWSDGHFDAVLGVNVAYFFDADGHAVSEARRVLRPGGRAVFYATERGSLETWMCDGPDLDLNFESADLAALLRKGGFDARDIHIERVPLPFGIHGLVAVASC